MSDPPFVLPQGFTQIPPNYAYKKVGERAFPLKAQKAVLKDLVDRCLNDNLQGTGISYAPIPTLTQHAPAYLIVTTYGSMASKKSPFSDWGTMSQTEVIFTIPLLAYKKGVLTGMALFTPFCCVDNSWSMITGNMILGYQKGLAWFQLPPQIGQPYPMEIRTPVFPVFSPTTPLSWETWIRIEKKGSTDLVREPAGLWPIGPVDDLYGPKGEFRVEEEVLGILHRASTAGLLDVVQLLQLRDPVDPKRAAYSKVVTFAVRLKSAPKGGLLSPAEIELRHFDSLPVLATLGLVGGHGRLAAIFPYWVESDFDFELQP